MIELLNRQQMMEKKKYIKPTLKPVSMLCGYQLAAGSEFETNFNKQGGQFYSRESSIWDDEEEEETTGGWFQ